MDTKGYTGHSFHIDAATTAAHVGVEDCHKNAGKVGVIGLSAISTYTTRCISSYLSKADRLINRP